MRRSKRLIAVAPVAVALAAAAVGFGPAAIAQDTSAFDEASALLASERNTIDVISARGDSVVAVSIASRVDPDAPFARFVDSDELIPQGSGSGFLIEYEGDPYLVTNYHVVEAALEPATATVVEGAQVSVTFPDAEDQVAVDVVGVNPSFDLALLQALDESELPDAEPLLIADSDALEVGQKTIAIGNPFGLASTVTSGIVSALERFVPTIGDVPVPMIQTDAAINPGNSGGPLLDSAGRLIGINTALINPQGRSFAGLGFAVPSNLLVESLANLEDGGVTDVSSTRPRLGISAQPVDLLPVDVREDLGLPDEGVAVIAVQPGSVADKAGLRGSEGTITIEGFEVPVPGDVIVAIDGRSIDEVEDINQTVTFGSQAGDELAFRVVRAGVEIDISVRLEVSTDNSFLARAN
ncbi:MAG: trypsin-like peptidase domain-containing protein [Candidatus Limnocylindrales bacterium]